MGLTGVSLLGQEGFVLKFGTGEGKKKTKQSKPNIELIFD